MNDRNIRGKNLRPAVGPWLLILAGALLAVSGCGPRGPRHALDRNVALTSLTAFLDEWKAGRPASGLQSREPSIVGKDPDWDADSKLTAWELVDSSFSDGVNLHAVVKLTVQAGSGAPRERQITYIVGTSPVVSIFRD